MRRPYLAAGAGPAPPDIDVADALTAAPVSSTTRRRLFALMATLTLSGPDSAAATRSPDSDRPAGSDPTLRLFAEVQARLAEHERALGRCDWLEAALVAEFGYPRVRLPGTIDRPAHYAAEVETIVRHVPPGRRRERLGVALRLRQERWEAGARACGLVQAQEREEALFRAVRAAADAMHAVPATRLTGIALKLAVLLSLEEPGEAARAGSPWRELRLMLADLGRLIPQD